MNVTITGHQPVNVGRLFRLKLERNREARARSMATIRQLPNGRWQAKVGGLIKGTFIVHQTRREVELAVDAFYNAKMNEFVLAHSSSSRS